MYHKNTVYGAVVFGLLMVFLALAFFGWASRTVAESGPQSNPADPTPQGPATSELSNPLDPNDQGQPLAPISPGEIDSPQAGPYYLHNAGSAFNPLYSTTQYAYGGSGCVYATGGMPYFNFPLELQYESTVNQLRLYFKDTDAANAYLWLAQYDDGLGYTYVVTATTTGTAGWGTTTVLLDKKLDYYNYSYALVWSQPAVGNTLQLCGFRVGYSTPIGLVNFLPFANKNYISP